MSNRTPVPIGQLSRRLPEAGRIRFGAKTGNKGAPKALNEFRFTSADRAVLDEVAAMYGGIVKKWDGGATDDQYEVLTTAAKIRIALPPDPLGGTPLYESWSGGGCQRRCDGETCEVVVGSGDNAERVDIPCKCVAEGAMVCTPRTRLSVILPDIQFGGTWRLDTGSWNAAQELPGMVDLLQTLQSRGLVYGFLRLEQRASKTASGRTNRFVVPVLGVDQSVDQLAAVSAPAGVAAIGTGGTDTAALDAGSLDDEVVDGELVDEADDGPVCGLCLGPLAGEPVKKVDGEYVHKECPT